MQMLGGPLRPEPKEAARLGSKQTTAITRFNRIGEDQKMKDCQPEFAEENPCVFLFLASLLYPHQAMANEEQSQTRDRRRSAIYILLLFFSAILLLLKSFLSDTFQNALTLVLIRNSAS